MNDTPDKPAETGSTERKRNIWAPWRIEYINELADGADECFLCRYINEGGDDRENLVLWRLRHSLVVLNRFPYTGGHCLVAPLSHVSDMDELEAEVVQEMMSLVCDMQKILTRAIHAQGFNIGINIGKCAGAGLPGHLHIHIVPRWDGDTNFMAVLGDVRVIPQSLDALYLQLREAGEQLNLPAATR